MTNPCKEAITQEDREIVKNLDDYKVIIDLIHEPSIKIYAKKPVSLSQIVLLLKDFGITAKKEIFYSLNNVQISQIFIDTNITALQQAKEKVATIIEQALRGETLDRCTLYHFVLEKNISLEQVIFLRSLVKYLVQLLPEKKEQSIIKIFLNYPHLINYFIKYFFKQDSMERKKIEEKIHSSFKTVQNYEEDKLLRICYYAICSIKKTNFFAGKECKSYKFDLTKFKKLLPSLQPNIEIFVYHKDFLGVHLRISPVSRGGIRWSDREDFRQEIRDLMITQEAKNAIIIPSGGKGGLYIEKPITKKEFRHYYELYIDAMLDLIDKEPKEGGDFYFVVAADKGTADMSDVANTIAIKRGYWLKDAFASGGSHGYSHKKLGVTAHGAWICAARHFIDRKIDIFKDPITVVGTGSMRGDVFGNGMLINPQIKLIGAISSHEIFIDPNPDPAIAFKERKRLFEEQKSWSDYNQTLISEGGGVFLRTQKEIKLSPQIKKVLGIKEDILSAEELAKYLLCAQVDMLYIGGIGTYVKASEEFNIYIADKYNEPVRVDASALQAFAVCEGGNLGLTQKARIEYAKNGGRINLDSIDNSAGVNTSDYEVNLKIVLNKALKEQKIDENQKHTILKELTQEVLEKVFQENFMQPLAITLDGLRSRNDKEDFIKAIELLERELEFFNKKDFDIPKIKEFDTVIDADGSIVRPVLGIVLSFSKIFLKRFILQSNLTQEPFFEHYLYKYFPKSLYPLFEKEVLTHPLAREIIATVAANIIIDNAGIRFIADFDELGSEKFLIKIKSYLLLYALLWIAKAKKELYKKESANKTSIYMQLLEIEDAVEFSVKWMVRNYQEFNSEPFHILNYKNEIAQFLDFKESIHSDFFRYIDLIKFVMPAIYIKELKEYPLNEVLSLLSEILSLFNIDALLQIIYNFSPKDNIGKELKMQLMELVEYFVVATAKDVVFYTRSKESLHDGLMNYIQEKMIDTSFFAQKIAELAHTPQDLMKISNVVHKLLLEAI
ncbi:glutamate dehydrogenase [Nitratiruptor sp. YY08-26]|uniref:NAD-glutamate dehydrogenase domain-containing protein n=1 Tax=unclassified Nitratiruptor TaxID=2624044 RepID=UPI001915B5E7|nr:MULTISPECIES: NAD-glutamate dehydrogenase domain-containing protein [unclassified Nitratiruptor]BCD62964.1 glutamate dehydrogenase [Nitratiruptor sp. YY08-13]BCD66899.1 glutamate dehydrogenase [Nitratiruptor sp. YY08-26]